MNAGLNVFSPLKPPYPSRPEEVNTDFAVKLIQSWQQLLEVMIGGEACQRVTIENLVSSASVFEKILLNIRSTEMRLISTHYFCHEFADILFEFFRAIREPFQIDNTYFQMTPRVSPMQLLKDMLDSFKVDFVKMEVFRAQGEKGRNLQCSVVSSMVKANLSLGGGEDRNANKGNTQPCLAHICRTFLGDNSNSYVCNTPNGGVCTRKHLQSKEEVINVLTQLSRAIESSFTTSTPYKESILKKLNDFATSG